MTGLLFTTEEEATPFLRRYEHGRFAGLTQGNTAHDSHLAVLLTGIGKIKATLRTERLLQQFELDRLLVVGTCTALSDELTVGEMVVAEQVLEGDRIELAAPTYPRLPLAGPFEDAATGDLVTQDHLITDEEQESYWQRIADMTDTTGYAVAYVAGSRGVSCHVAQVVTGRPNVEDEDLRTTLDAAYETLANFVLKKVEGFRKEEEA